MRRSEYLRLRAEQFDRSIGVERWDTCPLPYLQEMQATFERMLERENERLAESRLARTRIDMEHRPRVEESRRLLAYLRALRYLREHGIEPDWPRGSVAPPQ